jgi:hypothetical protein
MKVTVMTSLLTEGDVYVDSRQLITNLATNLCNALLEKMHRYILYLIGCVWLNHSSLAQRLFEVEVLGDPERFLPVDYKGMPLQDSVSICRFIESKLDLLKNEGYWLANLDNIQFKEGKALLKVFIGNKYESLIINRAKSDVKLAKKSSLHRFPRHMTRLEIPKLKAAVVRQFEDSGFPFANVRLDSFQVINSNLHCQLIVETGRQINYDSLFLDNKDIV